MDALKFLKRKFFILFPVSASFVGGSWFYLRRDLTVSTTSIVQRDEEYIDLPFEIANYKDYDSENSDQPLTSESNLSNLKSQFLNKCHSIFSILSDVDALKISQTSDYDRSVLLARTPNVDISKFRFPIRTDNLIVKVEGETLHFDLDELMTHLLEKVSLIDGQSECAKYFTEQTLVLFENDITLNDIFFHGEYNRKLHDHDRIERYQGLYFQALLQNIICSKKHALCLLENGLLLLLHKLRESYCSDEFQIWIAICISTLSVYKESHLHLYHTGWIRILVQWLNSSDNQLILEAAKTLYNMSNEALLHKSLYILNPIFNSDILEVNCDIIFIHGLKGGVLKTWRQSDKIKSSSEDYTYCWPKSWLASDFSQCRIIAVNYESFLSNWNINCSSDMYTLKDRSVQLADELELADVGKRPIVWVTHSMGGLLVKHILNHMEHNQVSNKSILEQTKGIVFYSVPHRGSEMAVWSQNIERIISPSSHVLELRKDCPTLIELHEKFVQIAKKRQIDCLSFGESKKCTLLRKPIEWKSLLVPVESANPGIGKFIILPDDHFNICKPKDRDSQSYKELKDFLCKLLDKKIDQIEPFEKYLFIMGIL